MERNYVIRNSEDGSYLSTIYLGSSSEIPPLLWLGVREFAFSFETMEEAISTITFISDVIDYELAEQLEILNLQPNAV